MLLCKAHWAMVPADLQADVYAQYRRGQCSDRSPSKRWLLAAARARRAVAEKEGRAPAVEFLDGIIATLEKVTAEQDAEARRRAGRAGR